MMSTAVLPARLPEIIPLSPRVDVSEESLASSAPQVLELLLADMTTERNIIWATDDYAHLGIRFTADRPITVAAITGQNAGVIHPRVKKSKARQGGRAKDKAEVFTPPWQCNEQNNAVDEAWFGRTGVFNTATRKGWRTLTAPVQFDAEGSRTWKRYVDEPRLEVACGEAPYLVSRYDATTGEPIVLGRRIGLLDRKLRVVTENCHGEDEWLFWVRRAFESIYGFEFQGDSLLLARENLLATYVDYTRHALDRPPSESELLAIVGVIVWNIWQMDAFTGTIPLKTLNSNVNEPILFNTREDEGPPCRIRDWRKMETVEFRSFLKARPLR
ncbi:MAG: hypothetical protein LBI99_02020 [Propionibacteriaceae bacterium]|jgi:hypothetical protein|nr:hypothetical protein [Propionibacteriaceae bacterium]